MIMSPYEGVAVDQWGHITDRLINEHPLKAEEIVTTVLKSWDEIFNSKIGSFFIGKEIYPSPQIMSFFLHELVAHYLSLSHTGVYVVGTKKDEKDVHCITDNNLSVEIKGSSHKTQIFANRSYAQPEGIVTRKNKNGYYITINFENFNDVNNRRPEIGLIRFGYLEHTDWIAQKAATGQQARLSPNAYANKLKIIYSRVE